MGPGMVEDRGRRRQHEGQIHDALNPSLRRCLNEASLKASAFLRRLRQGNHEDTVSLTQRLLKSDGVIPLSLDHFGTRNLWSASGVPNDEAHGLGATTAELLGHEPAESSGRTRNNESHELNSLLGES